MALTESIQNLNRQAMQALSQQKYDHCRSKLQSAEEILNNSDPDPTLCGMTLNNLGCYFKEKGDHKMSLNYFYASVEKDTPQVDKANVHLNICTSLSVLKKHSQSLEHAMKALELLKRA